MNELENLKVGDFVVVRGSLIVGDELRRVERLTKTQIVVGNRHYWKKDGRLVGGGDWYYGFIKPALEKGIERLDKGKAEKRTACIHQKSCLG